MKSGSITKQALAVEGEGEGEEGEEGEGEEGEGAGEGAARATRGGAYREIDREKLGNKLETYARRHKR